MIQGFRRPVAALLVASAVVAGWFVAPSLGGPAGPSAVTRSPGPSETGGPAGSLGTSPAPADRTPSATPPPASGRPSPTPADLGSVPVPLYGARLTPALGAALDARLEALRARAGVPGISASILFPDGRIWEGAAGMADLAARRPVTPATVFSAGSISKTFTSALILALIAEGRLGLDDRVSRYLPALAIDPAITVRQLLDHRSGLRDFFFHPAIDAALLNQPTLAWDAARSLGYVGKPYGPPGTSWHYSNTNYLVLGLLAESVGGASVAAQLRARFLAPLGLDRTSYQGIDAPLGPLAHSYRFSGVGPKATAVDLSVGMTIVPFTSVVTAAGAAGSIATTSSDLVRWARALYDGPALDRASRSEMEADAQLTAPYKPTVPYGLGVQIVSIDGHVTLGHSGRFLGARAAMRWVVGERVAIAVMTDQSRSDPGAIVAGLLRLALQPPLDCRHCPVAP